MNWLEDLKKEDFPEYYHELIEIVGLENTAKLAAHYAKQKFYFGHIDMIVKNKKMEFIRVKFTGDNIAALARATGYSERNVYKVLRKAGKVKDERQREMFGEK